MEAWAAFIAWVLCLAMTLLVHAAVWAAVTLGLVWIVRDKLRRDRLELYRSLSGSLRSR